VLTAGQIERVLTLLLNGEIDIRLIVEDKEATGTKRKRKTLAGDPTSVWKVEQLGGPPQPFSDALWGRATRDFMVVAGKVPDEAILNIISEARAVAENHKARSSKGTAPSSSSERANLVFR
jgi:hypothetical protein